MLESKLAVDCVTRILWWQILPAILQLVKSWLSDTRHRVTLGIVEFFFELLSGYWAAKIAGGAEPEGLHKQAGALQCDDSIQYLWIIPV